MPPTTGDVAMPPTTTPGARPLPLLNVPALDAFNAEITAPLSTMPADELPVAVPSVLCPGDVPRTSCASVLRVVVFAGVPAVVPVPFTAAASVLPVVPLLAVVPVVVVVGTLLSTVTVPS